MLESELDLVQYIFHMFERKPKDERKLEVHQDIQDALTLAFFNTDLEPCEVNDLPLRPTKGHLWEECVLRKKSDYDPIKGCGVEVAHFSYTLTVKGKTSFRETLYIEWDDEEGTDMSIDLQDWTIGAYEKKEDGGYKLNYYEADAIDSQKVRAKLALAAITSIV